MRIALLSPYSWSYPGGVTRHIDALGRALEARGHEVVTIAPYDPDDRLTRLLHRGVAPAPTEPPPNFISLGRTVGFPANGAVSNLAVGARALLTVRRALRAGGFDVVHLHEPVAPLACWDALCSADGPALVGTYHSYSENPLTNGIGVLAGARRRMNRLHVRVAVSEAARWTASRFFGGDYLVIPNGVEVGPDPPRREDRVDGGPLRILFIGQAVGRKGLPVLLKAFELLRQEVPATLTLVGPSEQEVEGLLLEREGVRVLGRVDERRKREELASAQVLCAPSLGGESFGIVIAEGFAAGLAVVASRIPGYSDLVRDGVDGLLVEPGDPLALAAALRRLAQEPALRSGLATAARRRAGRFSWQQVAAELESAYALAVARHRQPVHGFRRVALRCGFAASHRLTEPVAGERPAARARPGGGVRLLPRPTRRRVLGLSSAAALSLAGYGAAVVGPGRILTTLGTSRPTLLGAALGLMGGGLLLRSAAWRRLLGCQPALGRVSFGLSLRASAIGVLLSATLPARFGEPARALVVANRLGRARERLPAVFAAIVAQLQLNLVAVLGLGLGAGLAAGTALDDGKLALLALLPLLGAVAVVCSPLVVPGSARGRSIALPGLWDELRQATGRLRGGALLLRSKGASAAAPLQLGAWLCQLFACYLLLDAFGLEGQVGLLGAAAVLFAVNLCALLPASPGNVGVLQLATLGVLHGFGVGGGAALAFGVALQGLELTVAFVAGSAALKAEGLRYRELRRQALHALPVGGEVETEWA